MVARHVAWPAAWRIIASRYPPIRIYERLTPDPSIWDALIALEELTNPRVRDEVGQIALVAPEDRVTGVGATWVMAAFTHLNPKGSRFSDGSFGVYYAAASLQTAILETAFHWQAFARDSGDPPRMEDMRVLLGAVDADLEDVEALEPDEQTKILAPASYAAAQAYARDIRSAGALGVVYPSVRDAGGTCLGAFKPRAVSAPRQERHLKYRWDGARMDRYFDYSTDAWVELAL